MLPGLLQAADSAGRARDGWVQVAHALDLWVPKTCATWADALRDAVGSVTRTVPGGQV